MLPLSGIRVLDLSRILAGPWATQWLADAGATVWKVERPGCGDDTRQWGPPWLGESGMSTYFLGCNRGKRSLAVDFSMPEGAELIARLAARADVLIENFRPGGLVSCGLDAATLQARHPALVYCSISGFGAVGPWARRPGYDALIQAVGGLMSLTGTPNGEPGAGPQKVGVAVADLMTGMNAVSGILAALLGRARTGQGAHLQVSLLHSQLAMLANQGSAHLNAGVVPGRLGNAHPSIVPYQTYPTADGHLLLAVGNDAQFHRFCTCVGSPQWSKDPRFGTNAQRVVHRSLLNALITEVLSTQSTVHWTALLEAVDVPAGPVLALDQVFALPQVQALGAVTVQHHPQYGDVRSVRSPLHWGDASSEENLPPPMLGEHTRSVLGTELAIQAAALDRLAALGVIA